MPGQRSKKTLNQNTDRMLSKKAYALDKDVCPRQRRMPERTPGQLPIVPSETGNARQEIRKISVFFSCSHFIYASLSRQISSRLYNSCLQPNTVPFIFKDIVSSFHSLSFFLSLSLCLSLSPSLHLSPSLCLYISVSLTLILSLSVCISNSASLCFCLSLTLYLPPS